MSIPERRRARGFSLVELLVAIVVLSIAVTGVLLVYINTARGSAEALISKQALAIAEAMQDEIQLAAYSNPPGGFAGPGTPITDRDEYDDVSDYNGFSTTGVYTIDGVQVLAGYNVSVTVAVSAFQGIAEAKLITVTVTHPSSGLSVALQGYKINYP
jgi:MSHA pilin protein MshD